MVTGRKMKKMVLKDFLTRLLINSGSGVMSVKHGRSENSKVAACDVVQGKEKEEAVEPEEDHVFDQ